MTYTEAKAIMKTNGWDCERRPSKAHKWVLFYFDEQTQTQYDCQSNGFHTQTAAVAHALKINFSKRALRTACYEIPSSV